ncbi:succinylglutamate desuccinylase/aspartoacylase domain-containing protein [Xanthomarina spongicola]|uniref:Succinylglutamate desuccinylase n=1 Tax=Xanthomarina spongicola TaxID=570520 RepID=A0A316DR18_9FLAO|nr:succinylglutamate desuccinylase/aspartoacylase family protein [Xanthomarina spongicola]PWK20531.1 succinylglutamate desuccinylase [Xanthomarina spongicola]
MVKVISKALNKQIEVERIITNFSSSLNRPTIVFFAGIHGNETAGVFALNEFLKSDALENLKGNLYAIAGNLEALSVNKRFIEQDLNRLWTQDNLENLISNNNLKAENLEQLDLYNLLKEIKDKHSGPIYFIDLHTTSSKTLPFITINDALINRKFSQQFPVPIVLGIEEYLSGPLLSYINQLGYVSLGFESGQHDDVDAVLNGLSFIYLTLVFAEVLNKNDLVDFEIHYNRLKHQSQNNNHVFEVTYLHKIKQNDNFKMVNGFNSFQKIAKGKRLAISNNKDIFSEYNARIFMPLYQSQGEEGFFLIKTIKPIFLKMSELLRRYKGDNLLVLLPGISWHDRKKGILSVNLKVTKYLAKQIFHVFGFRSQQLDKTRMLLYNRERVSRVDLYKNETWFK